MNLNPSVSDQAGIKDLYVYLFEVFLRIVLKRCAVKRPAIHWGPVCHIFPLVASYTSVFIQCCSATSWFSPDRRLKVTFSF